MRETFQCFKCGESDNNYQVTDHAQYCRKLSTPQKSYIKPPTILFDIPPDQWAYGIIFTSFCGLITLALNVPTWIPIFLLIHTTLQYIILEIRRYQINKQANREPK